MLMNLVLAVEEVRVLTLETNDLIYDPLTKKIYASVPNTAGSIGNSITIIDPETGAVGPSIFVGNIVPDVLTQGRLYSGKLAISDDVQYLYVSLDNGFENG